MTGSLERGSATIRTTSVNLWYGSFQALHNVDLEVGSRLITALIGPSGCGKSTLLRCFNRMNDEEQTTRICGTIEILGKNIYDADVSLGELRQQVGMVFQRPNPLPMSVRENVVFGLKAHASGAELRRLPLDALVEQALREVLLWEDVKDRLDENAPALTLEQQQKLCIARLLPLKPEIILMDEPCSALDALGIAAIERLMRDLRDRYTLVIVTHNLAQARRVSDYALFMNLGTVVEQGPTPALFASPAHAATRAYVEGLYG
jgi:phosphate transport system ATP-binding protein